MVYSALDPFVPSISIFRLPNATFELRIHLHLSYTGSAASSAAGALAVADVELTPNGEYLLVTGTIRPSAALRTGAEPYPYACANTGLADFHQPAHGTLVWTDQPCGRFGRDVRLALSPGTEYVVLDRRVEYGDYVVRYTLRNKLEYPYQSNQASHTLGGAGVGYHHFGASVNGYHAAARFDYHNHVPGAPHFPPNHTHFHPHLSASYPAGPFPPTAFPNTIVTDAPQGDITVLPGSEVGVAGVTSTSETHGINTHLDQHTAHISNGYGYQYAQGSGQALGTGHTAQTGHIHLGLNQSRVSAAAGASGCAHVRLAESEGAGGVSLSASSGQHAEHSQSLEEAVGVTVLPGSGVGAVRESVTVESVRSTQTTERSAELDVTTSTNGITFVESSGQDGIVDITVLSGKGKVRESVTGGIVRESTQANHSSMQASAELDVTASTKHVTFAESSGQHGIQVGGNVAEVALLPGREIVRESTETQSSTHLIAQRSAEVDVATSTNRATITEASSQAGGQVLGETVDATIRTGRENAKQFVTGGFGWQSTEGNIQSSTQQSKSTQSSSELDVAASTNRVTLAETSSAQCGGQVAGAAVGVTVLAGGKHVRESQTGEIVRESTQEITESSTLQTTQASAELGITTSSHSERVAESSGRYSGQVAGELLDIKIAPGRRGVRGLVSGEISREAVTGETVQEHGTGQFVQGSTQEIQRSTTQTTQASAEVGVATSANRVTFAESSSQYGEQSAEEVVGATVLSGRGNIRESVIGETVQQSTQEVTESSTLQTTTQASAEVDVATSANRVTFAESSSQYGAEVSGGKVLDVAVLTGSENVRESVKGEIVREATEEITQSSSLETTQMSSELDISQQTIQSGGLITNTALSVGGGAVDYIRGPGRDGNGARVSVVEQEGVRESGYLRGDISSSREIVQTATATSLEYGSSSREIVQSTTQETSTTGETTAVMVTGAAQFVGKRPSGTVVSLVGERASGSRMQGFMEGTTIEAATLETTKIGAELSSADASGVAFQTGTRVGVVTADGRTITGEKVDSRITYQSGGQAASTEIRRTEVSNAFAETKGVEREFSLGRSQTDSSTEHVSHVSDHASRSSSSAHSDNWHVVSRTSSIPVVPTLGTINSQIQTTFESTSTTAVEQTNTPFLLRDQRF
ncbi:hypothetical protein JB92DRAFT_3267661 [Gautieria morchelliformis]|nr:hypothetical protein JB92DRAFT_3267661 [Gautieria morchelliformis]